MENRIKIGTSGCLVNVPILNPHPIALKLRNHV